MTAPAAEPLTCSDLYERVGWTAEEGYLSGRCCISCHEDADEGYVPLPVADVDGKAAQVCCAVLIAVDEKGSAP